MSMFYDGWRTVTVIWKDGTEEKIEATGRPDPYVDKDGVLVLHIGYGNDYRYIPLTSIREWRAPKY